VNDVVVTESSRGIGVGTALLRRAEELARMRGCFRMALVTATWREATIAFYRREGWQEYGVWFVKLLTDDVAASGRPVEDD
jgi:GNAT superfamily N-acetyltransferase